MLRTDGPTALILSRQKVKTLSEVPVKVRREGAFRGGYVVKQEEGALEAIIMATGSELGAAVDAAAELGRACRWPRSAGPHGIYPNHGKTDFAKWRKRCNCFQRK